MVEMFFVKVLKIPEIKMGLNFVRGRSDCQCDV